MTGWIEPLAWDTEFFGVAIGRATVNRIDQPTAKALVAEAKERGLACVYFEADPNDRATIGVLEENSFRLVDVRQTLEARLGPPMRLSKEARGVQVERATAADRPALLALSRDLSARSRFAADPKFAPHAERLYERWIERSLASAETVVLVARSAGEATPLGFISAACQATRAELDLVVIRADRRGQSLGRELLAGTLAHLEERGVEQVGVATQEGNVAALRLYERAGFVTRDLRRRYHRWLSPD